MSNLKELNEALDANIPRSAVKSREGAGRRSFSYLSADYVIDRMNRLFGNLNWATETVENKLVFMGEVNGKQVAHYIARVKVEAQHIDESGRVVRTSHTGTGYGDGSDSVNPGKAHELAAKEAESDALKRACKNFGQSMGLALYDKDQTNVEEDAPRKEAPKAAPKPGNQEVIAPAASSVTPSASASQSSRPKLSDSPSTRPKVEASAGPDRDNLNRRISTLSKILNSTGKASFAAQKEKMKNSYGADNKDQLTDAQAAELVAAMEALAQAAS